MKRLLLFLLLCIFISGCDSVNQDNELKDTTETYNDTEIESTTDNKDEILESMMASVKKETEGEAIPVMAETQLPETEVVQTTEKQKEVVTDPPATKAETTKAPETTQAPKITYVGNVNSKKFHLPTCSSLPDEINRTYFDNRQEAIDNGYEPCKKCDP